MATTTNYGWTTPDDTALVKDGASAIRSLGTAVDTTTKNLNPSTTLGDIEYRSSTANTNTRLAIGSTGDVLTVAAGVPSWAAPAIPVANWSLLNAGGTALTGAQTVTVSGISGKDKIMVLVEGASSANASSYITVRLNTDTGSNYFISGVFQKFSSTYNAAEFKNTTGNDVYIPLGKMASNAAQVVSGYCLISGCNSAGVKIFNSAGSGDGTTTHEAFVLGGYYNSASTISSISIFSSTGNLDAGTVYVYTSA